MNALLTILTIIFNYFLINCVYYWYHRFLHSPSSGILYKLHYVGHHKTDFPLKQLRKKTYSNDGSNGWFQTGGEFVFMLPILMILCLIYFISSFNYFINFMSVLIFVIFIGETHHSSFHLTKDATSHPESLIIHNWIIKQKYYPKYMMLHDIHHGKTQYNFGFIDMSMDLLFGTYCDIKPNYMK